MIRVEQTILEPPLGNCFSACLASILECPIETVPSQTAEEGSNDGTYHAYMHRVREWLRRFNLDLAGWNHSEENPVVPTGYAVLSINCGPWFHSVVTLDGEIIWNPDPRRDKIVLPGRAAWGCFDAFVVRDPTKPIVRVGLTNG